MSHGSLFVPDLYSFHTTFNPVLCFLVIFPRYTELEIYRSNKIGTEKFKAEGEGRKQQAREHMLESEEISQCIGQLFYCWEKIPDNCNLKRRTLFWFMISEVSVHGQCSCLQDRNMVSGDGRRKLLNLRHPGSREQGKSQRGRSLASKVTSL